ncbi:MAG: PorT family protein [Prevotella sp.]|nr:PorT family protein [Prevotella sp.]
MKQTIRLWMLAAAIILGLAASAQPVQSTITLQPKVGMSIARISGDNVNFKPGFSGGIEAQYQLKSWLGITVGAMYVHQGSRIDVYWPTVDATPELEVKTECINIPLMARFYVWRGLSLGIGVQPGFMVKGRAKFVGEEDDAKDGLNSLDIAIPASIAYELPFGLTAEARYCGGLGNVFKGSYSTNSSYKLDQNHNQVIEITLGYKFRL